MLLEFGAALKEAREKSGITLESIHEQTRINLRHLQAIERGDFPSVPPTYVRAFIREYARIVGLDEDATAAAYNEIVAQEKGIPKPPEAHDHSNLLPHLDDSIEIVGPGAVTPKHVEVQGTPEIEDAGTFIPPVRKSPQVTDDSSAIDIRTTSPSAHPHDTRHAASAQPSPPPAVPEPTEAEQAQSEEIRRQFLERIATQEQMQIQAPVPGDDRTQVETRSATEHSVPQNTDDRPPFPPPSGKTPRATEQREEHRIIFIGSLVVLIIIIAIYAIIHFQGGTSPQQAAVDSTSLKASLEAGKYLDSMQTSAPEPVGPPIDTEKTAQSETVPVPEKTPVTSAREDSLVLEAFSSSPVWFSVKMDTIRTERGSMGSNDHRVWKAKDRFVITLGDAGAITFFLNGREIGTLGDEGAVIKNVTLSRQNLSGN